MYLIQDSTDTLVAGVGVQLEEAAIAARLLVPGMLTDRQASTGTGGLSLATRSVALLTC